MVDRKDFLTKDGDVNSDMLDAYTVLMAGLGTITEGSEEKKKKSSEAARIITALYDKRKKEIEMSAHQAYQAQIRKQAEAIMALHRKDKPK